MKSNTKALTTTAVMAALICVAGPLTIPLGPIPLSLATFAVYLAGAVLGSQRGFAAVGIYLLLGMVGVPVFSGFSAGVQKLAGVTGGYLVGYLPCAFIAGLPVDRAAEAARGDWRLPLCMVAGTAVLYAIGTIWFIAQTGSAPAAALGLCVLPFLPGDAVKIAAACLLAPPIRRAIERR